MTDERTIDRLIAHLRSHVGELRRLEREGVGQEDLTERKRLVLRLQEHLAYAVRDLLGGDHKAAVPHSRHGRLIKLKTQLHLNR